MSSDSRRQKELLARAVLPPTSGNRSSSRQVATYLPWPPGDKTPIRKRKGMLHPSIERFIIEYRSAYPGVDKTTFTPALSTACGLASIKPIPEPTVGRIIHGLKKRDGIPVSRRIGINGRSAKLVVRERKQPRKKTRRKGFYAVQPGELVEIDTASIFVDGLKRYMLTAIDLPTRFAFAYTYKSSHSANARDFLEKLRGVAPF
tara:strand:+ start:272 stop:880 length:609 start_codon:yes stop_codon:yes gene_type:complete